jgi:hypothetical protein
MKDGSSNQGSLRLVQSKALFKLDLILWHYGNPRLFSRFHYAGTTGSIAEPHG